MEIIDDRPTTVDVNTGLEEHGVGIPNVRAASFRDLRPDPEPEEVADEGQNVTEDEVVQSIPQAPQVPEVEFAPSNPWARNRILEKEKKAQYNELTALRQELQQTQRLLQEVAQRQVQPVQEETKDEKINFEDNPAGAIFQKLEDQDKTIQELKNELLQKESSSSDAQVLSSVNNVIVQQWQNDQAFAAGIKYLGKIMENSAKRKYPDMPEQERIQKVKEAIDNDKIRWAREGRDPVESMMDLAIDYGFDPRKYMPAQAPQAEVMGTTFSPPEPKNIEGLTSIGGVQGSAPRSFSAKQFRGMNETEFNVTVNELIDNQELRATRSVGKTPTFSQLLPGKGRVAK